MTKPKEGTNPLSGHSHVARAEEDAQAGAALFSGGGRQIDLLNIDSPAALIDALTNGEQGRSCMSRGAKIEEDEECSECSESDGDFPSLVHDSGFPDRHSQFRMGGGAASGRHSPHTRSDGFGGVPPVDDRDRLRSGRTSLCF